MKAWKTQSTGRPWDTTGLLQWSHADEGVEDPEMWISANLISWGFNGATPMKAWKTISTTSAYGTVALLQWSHADEGVEDPVWLPLVGVTRSRFNGATPMKAWKTMICHTDQSDSRRFNGATPMKAWKTGDDDKSGFSDAFASMEPRR